MRASEYAFFDAPFLAFAHRGGALYPPNLHRENSVHAFESAHALGYRYFETDVHATADGVLLAFHDDRLDRVTDGAGAIAELPYAAVREVAINGEDAIPTLDELFERFPGVRFNIDAKAPESVDLLARTISRHGAGARVCVSSFGVRRLHRLRRRLGRDVASSASQLGIVWTRLAPWLSRAISTPAPALQLPISHFVGGHEIRLVTRPVLDAVHRAGKQVHVWTVDDKPTMEWLIDLGVDGIFTDRIDILKDVLLERGRWT